MGVSGNRDVDGDWALLVKVNGEPLEEEKIIAGAQGWQDLMFDLSDFSDQTVSIEIEARANNWWYEYAFFDYIQIDGEAEEEKPPYKDAFQLSTGVVIFGELLDFDGNTFKIKTEKGVIEKRREEITGIWLGVAQ
jgi:U3 small nucleolar ribonucleoprotein component